MSDSKIERAKRTRGYLNKNPGNIDFLPPERAWRGQVGREIRPNNNPGRFAVFETHTLGIRAIAGQLTVNQQRHGCNTVRKQINRWAPPNENDTEAYIRSVARSVGVGPDANIDVRQYPVMLAMVRGIIDKELGGIPYTDEEINSGLELYGITPASQRQPPQTVREVAATDMGKAIITSGLSLSAIGTVAPAVAALNGLHWAVGVAVVVAAAAGVIAYMIMKRREA